MSFTLAPLEVELLAPFGGAPPDEAHRRMLRIVDGYQSFQPAQTDAEKYGRIAALGTKWGGHPRALEAALVVKRAADAGAGSAARARRAGARRHRRRAGARGCAIFREPPSRRRAARARGDVARDRGVAAAPSILRRDGVRGSAAHRERSWPRCALRKKGFLARYDNRLPCRARIRSLRRPDSDCSDARIRSIATALRRG